MSSICSEYIPIYTHITSYRSINTPLEYVGTVKYTYHPTPPPPPYRNNSKRVVTTLASSTLRIAPTCGSVRGGHLVKSFSASYAQAVTLLTSDMDPEVVTGLWYSIQKYYKSEIEHEIFITEYDKTMGWLGLDYRNRPYFPVNLSISLTLIMFYTNQPALFLSGAGCPPGGNVCQARYPLSSGS